MLGRIGEGDDIGNVVAFLLSEQGGWVTGHLGLGADAAGKGISVTEPAVRRVDRATRVLLGLLAVAFVVSVVHYLDNYVNYADYPQPGPDDPPAPSATVIGLSWFVFTAFGGLAVWWWLRGSVVRAATALTVYSVSGLIGLGHYTVPGATEMPWWRQGHVVLDIVCGALVLGFALWAVLNRRGAR